MICRNRASNLLFFLCLPFYENIPKKSIGILRSQGYDIKAIGIDNPSITDKEVIEIAQNKERLIVTFDSDYGDLIFKHGYKPDYGVIYFRIHNIDYNEFVKTLGQILSNSSIDFKKS